MQGLIILSSSPFEVGEEVLFTPPSGPVSGAFPKLRFRVWSRQYMCMRAAQVDLRMLDMPVRCSQSCLMGGAAASGWLARFFQSCTTAVVVLLQPVEGIVLDVGWYRTTIRSFEREIFAIPNSVFSRNVVLNVTRKGREWRIFEFIGAPCAR